MYELETWKISLDKSIGTYCMTYFFIINTKQHFNHTIAVIVNCLIFLKPNATRCGLKFRTTTMHYLLTLHNLQNSTINIEKYISCMRIFFLIYFVLIIYCCSVHFNIFYYQLQIKRYWCFKRRKDRIEGPKVEHAVTRILYP